MVSRLIRLTERVGNMLAKVSALIAFNISKSYRDAMAWLIQRLSRKNIETDSARLNAQVQSLSGFIVILLAVVVTLILWATNTEVSEIPGLEGIGDLFAESSGDESPSEETVVELPPQQDGPIAGIGTVLFTMYSGAQLDIYALEAGASEPIRITDSPADDRDPAWSPDGQYVAFSSRRDGNWELYVLELSSGEVTRLTYDLAFEAGPTWSPDGKFIAYEAYYGNNLDIYIISTDGQGAPIPLTNHPAPDFAPSWITDEAGRSIAFVSLRDGNKEIYQVPLDAPDRLINLTNTPDIQEDEPEWGIDGALLTFDGVEDGVQLIYVLDMTRPDSKPTVAGQGSSPAFANNGQTLIYLTDRESNSLLQSAQYGTWNATAQTFALETFADDLTWSFASIPDTPRGSLAFAATAPKEIAYDETLVQEGPPFLMRTLPGVTADKPWLSDEVDASFVALKENITHASGWDILGRLDSVFWSLERPVEPGQEFLNWHKVGRSFSVIQEYNEGNPAQIELMKAPSNTDTYWTLYVRTAIQDGTLGEPLRDIPWDFYARTSGDPEAYENGGAPRINVPAGYYINFTEMARLYGWHALPSDDTWFYNWPGILYWQFVKTDGMTWREAAEHIYESSDIDAVLGQTFIPPTPVPTETPDPDAEGEEGGEADTPENTDEPTPTVPAESDTDLDNG